MFWQTKLKIMKRLQSRDYWSTIQKVFLILMLSISLSSLGWSILFIYYLNFFLSYYTPQLLHHIHYLPFLFDKASFIRVQNFPIASPDENLTFTSWAIFFLFLSLHIFVDRSLFVSILSSLHLSQYLQYLHIYLKEKYR